MKALNIAAVKVQPPRAGSAFAYTLVFLSERRGLDLSLRGQAGSLMTRF